MSTVYRLLCFEIKKMMKNNRSELLALRPNISTINEAAASNTAEQFQNQCLRPILKLQHDLLIQVFKAYIIQRKKVFYTLSNTKKLDYIEQSVRKDLKFKNRLVGLVLGHFTIAEYEDFLKEEKELTRRLTNLLIQRLQSQVAVF